MFNENVGFVTVRSSSTRLPGKCFLKLGKLDVISHVIKRARNYNLIPIVCTSDSKDDDKIVEIAKDLSCDFFRGPLNNKLLRWSLCCEHFKLKKFHTLDADNPYFCGEEVIRSLNMLDKGFDLIEETETSANGGATMGFSMTRNIIKKVVNKTNPSTNTDDIMVYFKKIKNLKKTMLSEPDISVVKDRMTLDYYEDYILLQSITHILGNMATRHEIFDFFRNNPDISKINKFRTEHFKQNKNQ